MAKRGSERKAGEDVLTGEFAEAGQGFWEAEVGAGFSSGANGDNEGSEGSTVPIASG